MAKTKTVYMCNECGAEFPRWSGRCSACNSWNTLVEMKVGKSSKSTSHMAGHNSKPTVLNQLQSGNEIRFSSGIKEMNRVLGGGIVPGEMILIGGEPGIGKSTLLLQVAISLSRNGLKVLYTTGEESLQQVKMRAERLNGSNEEIILLAETDVDILLSHVKQLKPQIVIVDSIQTMVSEELGSAPGTVSQVRECAGQMVRFGKTNDTSFFIVGHVTKDGSIAGPRVLEHMVDCVLYFEGDNQNAFRVLRAVKNRFGSTNEIGVFTMESNGLLEVENPSAILLKRRGKATIGSAVTAALEGTRPVLVEIQSLLTETAYGNPRRMTNGLDYNRVAMLMAVMQKKGGLFLSQQDAYVNAIGGIKVSEPAADLAISISIFSSLHDIPVDPRLVAVGEVGLTGEIRSVNQISLRISEAEKMGFKKCLVPEQSMDNLRINSAMEIIPVSDISQAIKEINRLRK
jgi:DNA repair protein RadA/Sms